MLRALFRAGLFLFFIPLVFLPVSAQAVPSSVARAGCTFTAQAGFQPGQPSAGGVQVTSTTISGCPEFHAHVHCVYRGGFTDWHNGPNKYGKATSWAYCNGDGNGVPNQIWITYFGADGAWHSLELWHS